MRSHGQFVRMWLELDTSLPKQQGPPFFLDIGTKVIGRQLTTVPLSQHTANRLMGIRSTGAERCCYPGSQLSSRSYQNHAGLNSCIAPRGICIAEHKPVVGKYYALITAGFHPWGSFCSQASSRMKLHCLRCTRIEKFNISLPLVHSKVSLIFQLKQSNLSFP